MRIGPQTVLAQFVGPSHAGSAARGLTAGSLLGTIALITRRTCDVTVKLRNV
jgi:hypothetical protein